MPHCLLASCSKWQLTLFRFSCPCFEFRLQRGTCLADIFMFGIQGQNTLSPNAAVRLTHWSWLVWMDLYFAREPIATLFSFILSVSPWAFVKCKALRGFGLLIPAGSLSFPASHIHIIEHFWKNDVAIYGLLKKWKITNWKIFDNMCCQSQKQTLISIIAEKGVE